MNCERCAQPLKPGLAQCPNCGKWHTGGDTKQQVARLSDILSTDVERIDSGGAWDDVWGGGIALTSLTLFGGEPGAGKSTLLTQIAANVPGTLMINGEEEPGQIKARANRLKLTLEEQEAVYIAPAFGGVDIEGILKKTQPNLIIMDSISAICEKVEERIHVMRALKLYATRHNVPSILITHINKESQFAGHVVEQHLVDTLLTLFLDGKDDNVRELRVKKNRFGPMCAKKFLMTGLGLQELDNSDESEEEDEEEQDHG